MEIDNRDYKTIKGRFLIKQERPFIFYVIPPRIELGSKV